jgi:integrase
MQRQGFTVENPFAGMKRTQDIQPVSPLPADVVESVWADLPLLRDGNPDAPTPKLDAFRRKYHKKHGHKARWLPMDSRKSHPAAEACILLALGAGLRRNECDKARWSWLRFDSKGDCFIDIAEESDFTPKGGTLRLIKIPRELHDALVRTRVDLASPYIIGGQESPKKTANGEGYRRPETFRTVNHWLRAHGVEGKNPLHRLRKQFGSEVATSFGLFAAQKLLGHSSPTVTARYYAAQTELPELTHVRIVG